MKSQEIKQKLDGADHDHGQIEALEASVDNLLGFVAVLTRWNKY